MGGVFYSGRSLTAGNMDIAFLSAQAESLSAPDIQYGFCFF